MLDSLREGAKGPLGKVIVLVVVMAFGLFGVSTVVPLVFSGGAPVSVNGEDISAQELQQRVARERQRLLQQLDGQVDPAMITEEMVRPRVIERAVQERLLAQAADEAGFTLSSREIDRLLIREPAFQENGEFSSEAFSRLAVRQGMNARQLRESIGDSAVTNQWVNGVRQTDFVLPFEARQYGALSNQVRSAEIARISPAGFYADATVSDDDITAYYNDNQDQFETPERVRVNYVLLSPQTFAGEITVSEADVEAAYESEMASYRDDAEKTIAHILIDTEERSEQAARDLAQTVQAKAQSGDFAALAGEYSDDPGSAGQGGVLGEYQPDVFPSEFESAVAGLASPGDVSSVIQTDFGFHILQLNDVETTDRPAFGDRAPAIRDELERAELQEVLAGAKDQAANLAFSSLDLVPLADQFDLEIRQSDWFTRSGGTGIAENDEVVSAAFSPEVRDEGVNSDVIELANGSLVVLNNNTYEPADTRPLTEVKDRIRERLRQQAAQELASGAADDLYAALSEGATDAIASSDFVTDTITGVTRFNEKLETGLIQAMFRVAEPAAAPTPFRTQLEGGTRIVGQVTDSTDGALNESDRAETLEFLRQASASATVSSVLRDLRQSADIEIR